MTLADKTEFESNLRQRKPSLFQQKACPLDPPQHHKAIRTATHRMPEEPRELVRPYAYLTCEVADSKARAHHAIDDFQSIANLAWRQLALHLSQAWLRTPASHKMPGQNDAHRF
jgi:hypothetical protein